MKEVAKRLKSIVLLNGELPPLSVLHGLRSLDLPLIAADGAALTLKEKGINVDLIVGDLDSIGFLESARRLFPEVEILERPDQETNDFEKCLRAVIERDLSPTLVVGMQGGDIEHSFNNWSVLIKLSSLIELWILEKGRVGVVVGKGETIEIQTHADKLVSLIPQPETILSTKGLRWPLKSERLALGVREGARNEVIDDTFSVYVESGSLLVFFGSDVKAVSFTKSCRSPSHD